jgi:D-alanyl-D-alanine endopeptidase (penicillin-binding protein 7)
MSLTDQTPPINKARLLVLFAGCISVLGIFAGVKVENAIEASRVTPSLVVIPVVLPAESSVSSQIIAPVASTIPISTTSIEALTPVSHPDGITAKAYIVGNVMTGHVYLGLNSADVLPVASMSKLITTIAATDTLSPTTTITITPAEMNVPPDGSNLAAGETFTLEEILYPLLLDSSNVAAEAVASSTDRSKFLYLMSSYAWEIGMPTAYFADPSGLDPHNHASASDMFALAKYLYVYRPDILAVTHIPHESVATTTEHGAHSFDSIHPFVNDPRFIGGKTGRTLEAGETMMTILRINNQPIAFIVLGSDYGSRQADTDLLIQKFQALQD